MTAPVLVIGASGEVGEGVTAALLDAGRRVVAAARSQDNLNALSARLGAPAGLSLAVGSLASDVEAATLADCVGPVSAVVVAVNGSRRMSRLVDIDAPTMASLLHGDLLSHFAAVRCFLPRLPRTGCFIGIGGGSADFILEGGVYMSMAQAALRQMYRGFAHERAGDAPALRELIIASVVAGRHHNTDVDPSWVTAREVGAQVVAMIDSPAAFPGPVWRISRRDNSGRPVVSCENGGDARALPL